MEFRPFKMDSDIAARILALEKAAHIPNEAFYKGEKCRPCEERKELRQEIGCIYLWSDLMFYVEGYLKGKEHSDNEKV